VRDRTVVWSDPTVQTALGAFLPVAVEVSVAMSAEGNAGDWFRAVAKQGHFGRTLLAPTQQGTYIVTPTGDLLASGNSLDPAGMLALFERAQRAWDARPETSRRRPTAVAPPATSAFRGQQPALALEVTMRRFFPRTLSDQPASPERLRASGLPRYLQRYAADKPETYWDVAENHDQAWFTASEARRLLPPRLAAGERAAVDPALMLRLARLHMLDTVRALSEPYPAACVERAELVASVVAVTGEVAAIEFEGSVRMFQDQLPELARTNERTAAMPRQPQRGYDAVLLGKATFHVKTSAFITLELIALGSKIGGSKLSAFASSTMGVAFVLAPANRAGQTAPRFLAEYGW
jgi:hypothetical protein